MHGGILFLEVVECYIKSLKDARSLTCQTGSLYKKVPLRFFQFLRILDMKGTAISTEDLGKVASMAKCFRVLNVESCLNIKESMRCCINFPHKLTCQILTNQSMKNGRKV